MKTIETQLDLFFKELLHTPGPWKFEDDYVRTMAKERTSYDSNIVADVEMAYNEGGDVPNNEEWDANTMIISASPELLREVCRTYLWLLYAITYDKFPQTRIHIDERLASLRNTIVSAIDHGLNGQGTLHQQVQETFEGYARELNSVENNYSFKTTIPDAIKTVDEAKAFLKALWENEESYHPEDNANGIVWDDVNPSPEQRTQLNKLRTDIYNVAKADGEFDPCEYLLALENENDVHG
jgi:hypothetical protein